MKVPLYHDSHFNMQYIYSRTMNMNELLYNHVIHRQYREMMRKTLRKLIFFYIYEIIFTDTVNFDSLDEKDEHLFLP